jgi:hypothetical protein
VIKPLSLFIVLWIVFVPRTSRGDGTNLAR